MKSRIYSVTTIVALLALSGTTYAQEAVQLRYKAKEGDKTIYKSVVSLDQTQTIMGNELKNKNRQVDYTTYTVKKVAKDGTIAFETKNERLKVDASFGMAGNYKFDSQSDERDSASLLGAALTPLYERLSGAVLTLDVSPLGKVKKLKGYEELVKDVLKGNAIAQQFAGGGTDAAALSGFQDSFAILKSGAVKPGDSWEEPYKLKLPKMGEFEGKRIYTYEAADKVGSTPTIKLSVTLELSGELDIDAGDAKVSGMFELDDSSGTIQFDPAAGRLVSLEVEQSFSGDLMVEAGGNTIPIEFEQTIKHSRKLVDKIPE